MLISRNQVPLPKSVRDLQLMFLDGLVRQFRHMVVVDRGHRHTSGTSEICFWFVDSEGASPAPPTAADQEQPEYIGGITGEQQQQQQQPPANSASAASRPVVEPAAELGLEHARPPADGDAPSGSAVDPAVPAGLGSADVGAIVKRRRRMAGASAWRVVGSCRDAKVYAAASFTSRQVRDLAPGHVVHGVIKGPDSHGIQWVDLDGGSGFVAVSTAACDFPGLGHLPARPILLEVQHDAG